MGIRALILALALALLAAAPASADRMVLVAYGEGTTNCTVTVTAIDHPFSEWNSSDGTTECSRAIQQSGDLTPGGTCSGFMTTCVTSGGWHESESTSNSATYTVTLRAPAGQGWAAPVNSCAGSGTD